MINVLYAKTVACLLIFIFPLLLCANIQTEQLVDSLYDQAWVENSYQEAIVVAKKGLFIADSLDYLSGIGTGLKTIGLFYTLNNQFDEADQYYGKAVTARTKAGNMAGVAYVYDNWCMSKEREGDYLGSIEYGFKALDILKELNKEKEEPSLFMNIANAFDHNGDIEDALYYYRLTIESADLNKDTFHLGRAHLNLSFLFNKIEAFDQALVHLKKVLPISKSQKDTLTIASVHDMYGSIYASKGDFERALENYKKSIDYNEQISDSLRLCFNYIGLANLHLKQNEPNSALNLCNTAKSYLNDVDRLKQKEQLNRTYSKIYKALGNYQKSYSFLVIAEALQDSLFNIEKNEGIQKLKNEKLRRENVELSLLKAETEVENQQLTNSRLFFGLLALTLGFGLFFLLQRSRRKTIELANYKNEQKIITDQKIIAETQKLRDDLAKKLHNHVATPLTHIKRFLEPVFKELSFDQELSANISRAIAIADNTHVLSRDISYELMPDKIDWVDNIKMSLASLKNMTPKLKVDGLKEEDFSKEKGVKIGAIICNALNNVEKHSKAKNVNIVIENKKDLLKIIVEDDGIGFQSNSDKGVGLSSIYSDVAELDGKIDIQSIKGEGTTVFIEIPKST